MNFATFEFLIFMICVYLPYLVLSHRWQNVLLLIASYFFYGWWDWRFLGLLLFSTALNYAAALLLHHHEKQRRLYLIITIIMNLGLLGFFKYLGFFVESMVEFLKFFGLHPNIHLLNIILPVGISFYTFQTMSYTIDVYRKDLKPTWNFLDFALFVSFFPQLVAGPIERAKNLLPQVQASRIITYEQICRGAFLILWGLFKKIVVADGAAPLVETVYGLSSVQPTALDIILATYLFTIQIYCDFSGYSDIGRGTAKLLGFELMTNFNLPLLASSAREFWHRWHISFVTWLRDYLYIPLGGNRYGTWNTQRNIMITLFLSGAWHGAAWNFMWWGVYQGTLVCVNHLWFSLRHKKPTKLTEPPVITFPKILQTLLFFQLVNYGFMLFRVSSLHQLAQFTEILLFNFNLNINANLSLPMATLIGLPVLFCLEAYQYVAHTPHFYQKWPIPWRSLLYAMLLFLLLAGLSNDTQEFIYFAF